MSLVLYEDRPTIDLEEVYIAFLDRKCKLSSYEFEKDECYRVEIMEKDGIIYTVRLVSNDFCK